MMDMSSDLVGSGIPFLDYRAYAERIFFPGHQESPLRRDLDVPESRRQTVEQGLVQLSNLLNSKLFLTKVRLKKINAKLHIWLNKTDLALTYPLCLRKLKHNPLQTTGVSMSHFWYVKSLFYIWSFVSPVYSHPWGAADIFTQGSGLCGVSAYCGPPRQTRVFYRHPEDIAEWSGWTICRQEPQTDAKEVRMIFQLFLDK